MLEVSKLVATIEEIKAVIESTAFVEGEDERKERRVLTDEDRLAMYEAHQKGESLVSIAKRFNVHHTTVYQNIKKLA